MENNGNKMTFRKIAFFALFSMAIGAAGAFAHDWHEVAELEAGGADKEIDVTCRHVCRVKIECVEGCVAIQTLWIRNAGLKRQFRVNQFIEMGDSVEIAIGIQNVTGLCVSDRAVRKDEDLRSSDLKQEPLFDLVKGVYRVLILVDSHYEDEFGSSAGDDWDDYDDWLAEWEKHHPPLNPPRDVDSPPPLLELLP